MRAHVLFACLFAAVLVLSPAVDAKRRRGSKQQQESSFIDDAARAGRRLFRQATAVFPLQPTNSYLRAHAVEIVTLASALLITAMLLFGRKRRFGVMSEIAPGYKPAGTRGGAAPRRRAGVGSELHSSWHPGVRTLPEVFNHAVAHRGGRPCFGTRECHRCVTSEVNGKTVRTLEVGEYRWKTYREVKALVDKAGSGLRTILGPKDAICIFANSCEEWQIAAHGAFAHSVVVATSYANLGEEALVFSLDQTEAKAVVCEAVSLPLVRRVAARARFLKAIVVIDGGAAGAADDLSNAGRTEVITFAELLRRGEARPARPSMPDPEDVAMIMYTSGSTGTPKGVVIRHRAIVAASAGLLGSVPTLREDDVYVAYLPLAHIMEVVIETTLMQVGAAIGFASPFTLVDNAIGLTKEGTAGRAPPRGDAVMLRPTLMGGVPRVWNTVKDRILGKLDAAGGLVAALVKAALNAKIAALRSGGSTPILDALLFRRRTAAALGGRLRFIVSGGGPLASETHEALFCVELAQGYGLTETCGAGTVGTFGDPQDERVGAPAACCDVRLVDWADGNYTVNDSPHPRGEICIGGHCLSSGYFKNEALTDESFYVDPDDGRTWFRTGDIGEWHEDGVLKIVGRKKSILKLSHGEYLSLEKVDGILQSAKYVAAVATHAESGDDFCVAVVVADMGALQAWARKQGLADAEDGDALVKNPEAIKEVHRAIKDCCRESGLVSWEIPRHIVLDNMEWTPENGLLTAAMKLRRKQVVEHYEDQLARFYTTR